MVALSTLLAFVALQRLLELRLARRHHALAEDGGAREFGAGHYRWFFVLHVGWLIGWVSEAWVRGPGLSSHGGVWLVVFAAAQGLRYWAIATLGERWTTRIFVRPGLEPVRGGPYRWLSHPNYVAVALELVSVPMALGAWWTAIVASLANAALLGAVRIPQEVRALRWAAGQPGAGSGKMDGSP